MTKTLGQILMNEQLPTGMSFEGQVTKKKLYKKLTEVARRHPHQYGQVVQGIKRVGDMSATLHGLSVGLDDIAPDYKNRNALISRTLTKMRAATTDSQKEKILLGAQDAMTRTAQQHKGELKLMSSSGGRGSANQLMKMVAGPVTASDPRTGIAAPWLIRHSYAEGLRPDEMWVANAEARHNAIITKEAISGPGAFSKMLTSNMSAEIVFGRDCNTRGGTRISTVDQNLVGRHLATAAGGMRRDTLITEEKRSALVRKKVKYVSARSPLTCEARKGVCQLCYGLDEFGKLPKLGTNLGLRSAQALSEPLTQFAMNAKHGVRLVGSATLPGTTGLHGIQNFLEFPRSFSNKAILSDKTGHVSKIKKAPQGGFNVTVSHEDGTSAHYIPPQLDLVVGVNDKIDIGDSLSRGIPMPDEIVLHKGLSAGRRHIADTLHGMYAAQGSNIDKRHVELLAKSHLAYVRIAEDPSGDHTIGEVVPYNSVRAKFGERASSVPLNKAVGRVLAKHVLHYGPGTLVTPSIRAAFKREKITSVPVSDGKFRVRPVVKPLTRNPLMDPDFMAKMSHRYIRRVIRESAAEGGTSNIHGANPVPGYVFGAEFGLGGEGEY